MDLEERQDGSWITGVPDGLDCGPYDCEEDAASGLATVVDVDSDQRLWAGDCHQPALSKGVSRLDDDGEV